MSADDDPDLRDAYILLDHLDWFSSRDNKARWLALILSGRRSEIEYRANMSAVRKMMGERNVESD